MRWSTGDSSRDCYIQERRSGYEEEGKGKISGAVSVAYLDSTYFFWALLLLATFLNFSFKYRVSLQIVALFPYFLTVFKLGFQGDFIEKISYAWLSIRKLFK